MSARPVIVKDASGLYAAVPVELLAGAAALVLVVLDALPALLAAAGAAAGVLAAGAEAAAALAGKSGKLMVITGRTAGAWGALGSMALGGATTPVTALVDGADLNADARRSILSERSR